MCLTLLVQQTPSNNNLTAALKYNGSSWSSIIELTPMYYMGFTPAEAEWLSLAINPVDGTLYLAFQNFNIGKGLISVMKFNGGSWNFDGGESNEKAQLAGQASWDDHLKFDSNGNAYLSYFQGGEVDQNGTNNNYATSLQYKTINSNTWRGINNNEPNDSVVLTGNMIDNSLIKSTNDLYNGPCKSDSIDRN